MFISECLVQSTVTALYQKVLSVGKHNLLTFSKHITTPGEASGNVSKKCSWNPFFYPLSCRKESYSGNLL